MRMYCQCSSVVERFLGKEEVTGPTPVIGSKKKGCIFEVHPFFLLFNCLVLE